MRSVALACLLLLFAGVLPAVSTTYVVRPDGTGDAPTIQAAVNRATHGDVILLTSGTFQGAGNRDIDLLGKRVTIRSDPFDPWSCTIDCQGSQFQFHNAFSCDEGETAETLIEGIRITNGYGQAAIDISNGSPTIRNCIFQGNHGYGDGGGIHVDAFLSCAPLVQDCLFAENTAGAGGGIAICWNNHSPPYPRVERCTFAGNSATEYGGGARL